MKHFLIAFLMVFLTIVSFGASREYTVATTLDATVTSYQFDVSEFEDDTISFGDTVTFNVFVDVNKHVEVVPALFVLLDEAGTTDSLKITSTINYSQFYALVYETSSQEEYYYKTSKTSTSVLDFNSAGYYPVVIADSVQSSGLVYPMFAGIRSAYYKVIVIPLKTDVAVVVSDFRFKIILN